MATGLIDIDQILASAIRRMKQGNGLQESPAARSHPSSIDWGDIDTRAAVFMHAYTNSMHQSSPPAPASAPVPDGVAGDMAAAAADAWPASTCGTCRHFSGSLPRSVKRPEKPEYPEHFGCCENAVNARLDHRVRRQPIGASVWAGKKDCNGYSPIKQISKMRLAAKMKP